MNAVACFSELIERDYKRRELQSDRRRRKEEEEEKEGREELS